MNVTYLSYHHSTAGSEPLSLTTVDVSSAWVVPLLLALGLAAVHPLVGRIELASSRRQRWLSAAGGATIAYVFVLVFPELSEAGLTVVETVPGRRQVAVYLVSLVGFVLFYGVDTYVVQRRREEPETSGTVFRVHIGTFLLYNTLIGYLLLHQQTGGLSNQFFYGVAMALHFVVNDYGLREHHRDEYDRRGRWLLAAGVLVGVTIGAATEVHEGLVAVMFAFLAGGIVFNAIRGELPNPKVSRFGYFLAGAASYTVVLLML